MHVQALPPLFFFLVCAAFAQSNAGVLTGTVSDPAGAAVVGAPIVLKNAATGNTIRTASFARGKYAFSNLPAGTYELAVDVVAMSPFSRKGLTVAPGQTVECDVQLAYNTQLGTLGEDRISLSADLQKHAPPAGPAPRTFDGKPDLSGVWWSPRTIDPGQPQFLPEAQAVARQRTDNLRKDTPQAYCLPSAILRIGPLYEFVQSKDYLVEISDDDSPGFHQIYLDGRPHPEDPNPAWYGDNIGHWEGDTLVVDRVAFDPRVWLDQAGHPHSSKLHVIERYRRPDFGHLETEITVEDPGILAHPFTEKRVSDLAPAERIYEFICPEDNRDVNHMVGK